MRAGIYGFPSRYAFPSNGYGGIERWLWAVAAGAGRTELLRQFGLFACRDCDEVLSAVRFV